jgi:hypothetical protein
MNFLNSIASSVLMSNLLSSIIKVFIHFWYSIIRYKLYIIPQKVVANQSIIIKLELIFLLIVNLMPL